MDTTESKEKEPCNELASVYPHGWEDYKYKCTCVRVVLMRGHIHEQSQSNLKFDIQEKYCELKGILIHYGLVTA